SGRAFYGVKKKPPAGKEQRKTLITKPKASTRKIRIASDTIIVADLAREMGVKGVELIQKLFTMGTMATINQPVDIDTAVLLATEFSYEIERVAFDENTLIAASDDKPEETIPRSPVVTMMGHVDHGKTSILDAIRETKVADKEAGGITQQIGAYEVKIEKGTITFIDTPGHEAFTEMRARGSQVTDIVVLVVAADDGVMPQTRESIDHAKAAGVEIVVAINKVDKPNANVDMVKKQLAELELLPEDWGGQTMTVLTSARNGDGIKKLMETILLQAEIMELRVNPNRAGEGVVIEARLDKGMGPCATVITQRGTLKVGDYVVAGTSCGRIRSIKNSHGKIIDSIIPGRAGEILGLDNVPMAGEKFNCVSSEYDAKKLVDHRVDQKRKQETPDTRKSMTLEEIMQGISKGETKELKLVVKADTQGSIEALKASLENLSDETVGVKVMHAGVGGVTSNDVNLAVASGAVIIAFNVRPDTKATAEAERVKLDIKYYDVIYNCLDDMEKVKKGMLSPTEVEKVNGQAEVREIFNISRLGTIAGCGVKSGKIIRNSMVRVIRDGVVVYTGKIKSLKRFKDDARDVAAGLECGMSIDGFNDIKPGDIFESYSVNMINADGDVVGTKKNVTPANQNVGEAKTKA
ncbi:MAG: translation initiation factor IF-2, partial [Pseudomonadota bacterium]